MLIVVALWGFAEATLFFIVADLPISAIGLRCGWGRAWRAGTVAAVAAALGGQVMLHWSRTAPSAVWNLLLYVPGLGPDLLAAEVAAWRQDGFTAMASGAFRGVPYKVYATAAGLDGTAALPFFVQSIAARLPRFLLVAAVSAWLGPRLRRVLSGRAIAALFVAFWTAFYAFYFAMTRY